MNDDSNLPTEDEYAQFAEQANDPDDELSMDADMLEALAIDELIRQDKAKSSPVEGDASAPPIPEWYRRVWGDS